MDHLHWAGAFTGKYGVKLGISCFLGIAIGPLVADLFSVILPAASALA